MKSTYHLAAGTPIEAITFQTNQSGTLEAILFHSTQHLQNHTLQSLRQHLSKHGLENTYPDVLEDSNILVVPHIDSAAHLITTLVDLDMVPKKVLNNIDDELNASRNYIDVIRDRAVKVAGLISIPGQVAMAADGILKGDFSLGMSAVGVANPMIMCLYGTGQKEKECNRVIDSLSDYLSEEGITPPKNRYNTAPKNILETIECYVSEHPQQVGYGISCIAGIGFLASSLREFQQTGEWKKVAIASTSVIGSAIVSLVPQKDKLQDTIDNNWFNHIADFVQESPLRTYEALNATDSIFWGMEVHEQFFHQDKILEKMQLRLSDIENNITNHQGNVSQYVEQRDALLHDMDYLERYGHTSAILKGISATCFGLSNLLASLPKPAEHHESSITPFTRIYAAAAESLTTLPPQQQFTVLEHIATFLSKQNTLQVAGITQDEIKEEIKERLDVMIDSPWIQSYKSSAIETNGVHTPTSIADNTYLDHNTRYLGKNTIMDYAR